MKVWESDSSSHDTVSKKKAEERLRKINEAYGIFKKNLPGSSADLKKNNVLKITAFAGAVLIIFLIVLALYSNVFKTDETPGPQTALKEVKTDLPAAPTLPSVPTGQVNTGQASGPSVQETSKASAQPAISGEITEEKAIEIAKKSQSLTRNISAEAVIKNGLKKMRKNFRS